MLVGDNLKIVCVLPAYNEQGKIGNVVRKVSSTGEVDQIVVVDDFSTDDTALEATNMGATVLSHKTNLGVGAAIRTGMSYGRQEGYDICVVMSGDDQHEPAELPDVLEPLRQNDADFVQGSRRLQGGKSINGPAFREITTRIFSLFFSIATLTWITDGTNGFRAFKLSILDEKGIDVDQEWLNSYELEPYLLYRAVQSNETRVVEVPITIYYHDTKASYSKMRPIRDWWHLLRPLLFLRLGLRR